MIGIIVVLVLSWLLLYGYERATGFEALGLRPTAAHMKNFGLGLLLALTVCSLHHFLEAGAVNNQLVINPTYTLAKFGSGLLWVTRSVLFEELLFRGALLYIAIKKLGGVKACLLSALCFGVYHWFSYGILGQPFTMALVLIITGIAGWMFAYAYWKTKSLYFPIGLHLGWNIVHILVFSQGPLGTQLLLVNKNKAEGILSLALFLVQLLLLPVLTTLYFQWPSRKKHTGAMSTEQGGSK